MEKIRRVIVTISRVFRDPTELVLFISDIYPYGIMQNWSGFDDLAYLIELRWQGSTQPKSLPDASKPPIPVSFTNVTHCLT